ncbi:DUF2637 domain-containing protein [Streptomyces roseochromogenus]|uniref:DUF2637 domain-containing protein n=1 Tax=Streptomyces roseochromogenus subsp. oscitans DS 12.976 TaxID=1352936 RepID=V6JE65_STRRC|nr:DUF2637 domain-containing protein [Streptomyces roseochromogenus]EST18018.1 hypothetical protein M878_45965 [Streptomyces roseochromogenus subsp. oscitans DS 12.976]
MHRVLIGVVVTGALIIAGIGFAGSYAAVRALAIKKGFGNFSYVFPVGIDAGICVLLALDLLLTWIRIPFPLLRQTAWLLTAATIAFNGAAAWPDPLGVGMHAVIPILFVVAVEAARHAIGRIADITADKHMEGVRLTRWLLSPVPTFLLWRRMKLWELRSYDQVIKLEQERLVYQASLRSRYGRAWRRKAPVESLMPLRLARYGVPLAETAPAGLAAAGIDEPPIAFTSSRAPVLVSAPTAALEVGARDGAADVHPVGSATETAAAGPEAEEPNPPVQAAAIQKETEALGEAYRAWLSNFQAEPTAAQFALWIHDNLGIGTGVGEPLSDEQVQPLLEVLKERYGAEMPPDDAETAADGPQEQGGDEFSWEDYFHSAWVAYTQERGGQPSGAALAAYVYERDGITNAAGGPITAEDLEAFVARFQERTFGSVPMNEEADGAKTGPVDQGAARAASSYADRSSVMPARVEQSAMTPTASAAEAPQPLDLPQQQTVRNLAPSPSASSSAGNEATARMPEQAAREQDLDPIQQQIAQVAGWLAEAEEAGKKLSGSEVGRRLGVAERTGRRRLAEAEKYLSEQRRQQARAHLRSVTDR